MSQDGKAVPLLAPRPPQSRVLRLPRCRACCLKSPSSRCVSDTCLLERPPTVPPAHGWLQ